MRNADTEEERQGLISMHAGEVSGANRMEDNKMNGNSLPWEGGPVCLQREQGIDQEGEHQKVIKRVKCVKRRFKESNGVRRRVQGKSKKLLAPSPNSPSTKAAHTFSYHPIR